MMVMGISCAAGLPTITLDRVKFTVPLTTAINEMVANVPDSESEYAPKITQAIFEISTSFNFPSGDEFRRFIIIIGPSRQYIHKQISPRPLRRQS